MRYLVFLLTLQLSAATVYYIPGYGESTSIGTYGGPVAISSTQPYSNLMLDASHTGFVPLVENQAYVGFPGLSGTQESPLSSAMNNLTKLSGGTYAVIANNYGAGSQTIVDLSKNNTYNKGSLYAALLDGIRSAKLTAARARNKLVVPGILFTQGGNDFVSGCHGCPTSPPRGQDNFKALSVAFQAELEKDIKAITGQSQPVVFFFSQQTSIQMINVGTGAYPDAGSTLYTCPDKMVACIGDPTGQKQPLVPLAQYELARDYPSLFYLFNPSYPLTTAEGYAHLDTVSYNRWGAMAARIMKTVLVDGVTDEPGTIMPKAGQITYEGDVITLPVTTLRNLDLVVDTTSLPVPFRNGAADTHGMGFQVFEYDTGASDMDEIPIANVSVAAQTVTLKLSAAPTKANVRLVYAFEGQRYAGSPVAGCAHNAATCTINGVTKPVAPWQGQIHGNIRTVTDYTDLHGDEIQYWMPTFNEAITKLKPNSKVPAPVPESPKY